MLTSSSQEKTLASCVTALLNAPNPDKLSPPDLASRISSLLPLVLRANANHARDVHLATFNALKALFERLPPDLPLGDAEVNEGLEKLLFDPGFEGLPEAMRMKRAEALVEVARVRDCAWVVERVGGEVERRERSAVVRGVLGRVGKE